MWLIPADRTSSMVLSDRPWLIPPRAAAPKITRVLRCPVRPNGRRSIMDERYSCQTRAAVESCHTRGRYERGGSRMRRWLTRAVVLTAGATLCFGGVASARSDDDATASSTPPSSAFVAAKDTVTL